MIEECSEIVDEDKIYNETLNTISSNDSLSDCVSCTPYIVLFAVFLVTSVIKESNDKLYLKKDNARIKLNLITQKTNY